MKPHCNTHFKMHVSTLEYAFGIRLPLRAQMEPQPHSAKKKGVLDHRFNLIYDSTN